MSGEAEDEDGPAPVKDDNEGWRKSRSLPLLIVVIDELYPFDSYECSHYSLENMLENTMRMSHALGISLVCSSQLPITMIRGIPLSVSHLFNIRIALRTRHDLIYESLSVNPSEISQSETEAIDRLTCGKPGEFVFFNKHSDERILFGQVGL